ncbi:unnamed protein product [Protopolystoma xenopodis]|uniref:Uncharacterized protein n=1 Tax=Protopolystoma xenopodis TaxID=117903 RepID=A0A3S5BUL9_9PLAT|nr:unnamed protein product [Protopolystoma xenopodis]
MSVTRGTKSHRGSNGAAQTNIRSHRETLTDRRPPAEMKVSSQQKTGLEGYLNREQVAPPFATVNTDESRPDPDRQGVANAERHQVAT